MASEHKWLRDPVKPGADAGMAEAASPIRFLDADRRGGDHGRMRELLRTNDAVLLSWLTALLRDSGIEASVLDAHTSVIEGSIGALPRRLVVDETDYEEARRLVEDSGAVSLTATKPERPRTPSAWGWLLGLRRRWS